MNTVCQCAFATWPPNSCGSGSVTQEAPPEYIAKVPGLNGYQESKATEFALNALLFNFCFYQIAFCEHLKMLCFLMLLLLSNIAYYFRIISVLCVLNK